MEFMLDARLAESSHLTATIEGVQVRLADDARYVWLLLVPEQNDISELHDLADADRRALLDLANELGVWMKTRFGADKINTAAIGNVVAQLHLHVVARHADDAAWPAPIWGLGEPQPRTSDSRAAMMADITKFLETRSV